VTYNIVSSLAILFNFYCDFTNSKFWSQFVQRVDNVSHFCLVLQSQPHYPVDRDLSLVDDGVNSLGAWCVGSLLNYGTIIKIVTVVILAECIVEYGPLN